MGGIKKLISKVAHGELKRTMWRLRLRTKNAAQPLAGKIKFSNHQNRHQCFGFPPTVSSSLLRAPSKDFNFSADALSMKIHHLKGHKSKTPTNQCHLSLRDLQGGSAGSSCGSFTLQGISLITQSGIRFCCLFSKQLGKPHAKHSTWKS